MSRPSQLVPVVLCRAGLSFSNIGPLLSELARSKSLYCILLKELTFHPLGGIHGEKVADKDRAFLYSLSVKA